MEKKVLKYLTVGVAILILFLLCLFFWTNYPDLVKAVWLTLALIFWPLAKILVKGLFQNWLFATIVVLFLIFLILKQLYSRK